MNKIIDIDEVPELVNKLRKDNKKIVFTNGCFDILHVGHTSLLEKASEYGDVLIVGVNSDKSVKSIKGKGRPIQCEIDRTKLLSAISYVSYVVVFGDDTPEELVKMIAPDVLVKGGDYKKDDIVGSQYAKIVVTVKYIPGKSTTIIEKNLRKSNKPR